MTGDYCVNEDEQEEADSLLNENGELQPIRKYKKIGMHFRKEIK